MPTPAVPTFDLVEHHRQRTRTAEARANALERHRDQLERLLILALHIAAGDQCDPIALLTVLEQIERSTRGPSVDELVRLLQNTEPANAIAA